MAKVLYERDGRIARITLNRPDVMNAIDDELPGALADAVARADNDPGRACDRAGGAGRAFCAGYDLTGLTPPATRPIAIRRKCRGIR
jgi:enoyl-CoA hydratase